MNTVVHIYGLLVEQVPLPILIAVHVVIVVPVLYGTVVNLPWWRDVGNRETVLVRIETTTLPVGRLDARRALRLQRWTAQMIARLDPVLVAIERPARQYQYAALADQMCSSTAGRSLSLKQLARSYRRNIAELDQQDGKHYGSDR